LALTGPLFDGGRLRAARRASIAAKAEALAAYREVVLQAFVQISDLMQALIHDQEAITAEHRAAASAAQDLDLAQKGFGAGGLPLTPALDAERTLNAARRRETAARARYALDVISLFVASGADFTASPIRPGL
jgi:outer membrane protein TolC